MHWPTQLSEQMPSQLPRQPDSQPPSQLNPQSARAGNAAVRTNPITAKAGRALAPAAIKERRFMPVRSDDVFMSSPFNAKLCQSETKNRSDQT
jgi:hypothetical protein